MQRDHHPANDDDDKQKDDEQADAQSQFLADHWKNEIGVRVGQIEHFLATVAETKPFHTAAAPRDQRLHLLQTGILFVILRMYGREEAAHSLRHAGGGDDKVTE